MTQTGASGLRLIGKLADEKETKHNETLRNIDRCADGRIPNADLHGSRRSRAEREMVVAATAASRVAEKPVDVHDFHATILHLLGIDHTRLTFYHDGIQRRLTNVHGNVLSELLS